jgi:hypothetical protein
MWYVYIMEFYSAIKKNEILSFAGQLDKIGEHHLKWNQPDSEKLRPHIFSHMWNKDPIQIQAILWKTGHTKGRSYTREGEGKRRKLTRWIWLMYSLYKNEYRIFKPVEITIRRGLRYKGEKSRGWTNSGYNTYIYENITMKHPIQLS